MIKLLIIHYHLLPGGVTSVIRQMCNAIYTHTGIVDSITIAAGNAENTAAFKQSLPQVPLQIDIIPELDYIETHNKAHSVQELAAKIQHILTSTYAPMTWWVHNPHLGKNPALTIALQNIAAHYPQQKMVLHIHDFPESGRPHNLQTLYQSGMQDFYPQGRHIQYATINSRDSAMLKQAVLPAHYLPNPVDKNITYVPLSSSEKHALREKICAAVLSAFPQFNTQQPWLIYPVRTIRRKNILEAALIAAAANMQLIVSLPGLSATEQAYSKMVQLAFEQGSIPGIWNTQTQFKAAGISFQDIMSAADCIISSSIQEGFGYQFLAPLILGSPLIARKLPVFADIQPLYNNFPHVLYDTLHVPSQADIYEETIHYYQNKGLTKPQLAPLMNSTSIEFSYLPPRQQLWYLQNMHTEPALKEHITTLNQKLFAAITQTIPTVMQQQPSKEALVMEHFNIQKYAEGIDAILHAAETTTLSPPAAEPITNEVQKAFSQIEYQRALYE